MGVTTKLDRDQILEAMQTADLWEDDLYEGYSGRAMYGETCFGVVCDSPGKFALFCAALGSSADDWDFVNSVRTDSMGLSTIYYFPGYELGDGEEVN